jgi:hypothetical protein
VAIPPGVCALYLADKASCPGCGKAHERWGSIVKKINEGQLPKAAPPASKGKANPRKKHVTTTTAPSTPTTQKGGVKGQGRGGNDKGGGRGGRGGKGGSKEKPNVTCTRCAQKGHELANCWATTHADGHKLTCPKPAPIPAKFQKSVTSFHAKGGAPDREWDGELANERDDETYEYEEAMWPTARINVLRASAVGPAPPANSVSDSDPEDYLGQSDLDDIQDDIRLQQALQTVADVYVEGSSDYQDATAQINQLHQDDIRFQRALREVANNFADGTPDFHAAVMQIYQPNLDLFWEIVQEQRRGSRARQEAITELVDNTKHALTQVGLLNNAVERCESIITDSERRSSLPPQQPYAIDGAARQLHNFFESQIDVLPDQPDTDFSRRMAIIDVDSSSDHAGLHWNVNDAFIHGDLNENLHDRGPPPLEDVDSEGEAVQDFKENDNISLSGLMIEPLEAAPTFIILQDDHFDNDLFEAFGAFPPSEPHVVQGGRQL